MKLLDTIWKTVHFHLSPSVLGIKSWMIKLMAWCRYSNKTLSEPIKIEVLNSIYGIIRAQWVNVISHDFF